MKFPLCKLGSTRLLDVAEAKSPIIKLSLYVCDRSWYIGLEAVEVNSNSERPYARYNGSASSLNH